MTNDPIADLLTRIRNANARSHETVSLPCSKTKVQIAQILRDEGYIRSWKVRGHKNHGVLKIYLKHHTNKLHAIIGLKRISKPGLRVYATAKNLPQVLNGLGIAIISTSRGILTDKEARTQNLGGEVMAYVW